MPELEGFRLRVGSAELAPGSGYLAGVPVREARRSDLGEIASLICELADYERLRHEVAWDPAELEEAIFRPGSPARVLIAEHGGEVAGFALYFESFSTFLWPVRHLARGPLRP
ncbi:MAG: hypothetical protein ACRD0B_04770 [Acidimicrobiales bacterium]